MTSSPRKILPTYIQSTSGNSNISYYQARAAAQVYSTARSVLPSWTTNYFLPDPPPPQTPSSPSNNQDPPTALLPAASLVDHSLQDRFVAFDVLKGRDVLVKAKDCGFTIFNVGDRTAELDELCGYSYFDEVIYVKIIPNVDSEAPPKAAILTKTDRFEITLSIVSLSTSLTADHSVVLPKNIITTSLITSQHYIAIATPKTITVYSPTLAVIVTLSTPIPTVTGSARWLIYPTLRPNPQLPRSQILDTPPETRLVERVARGLTKEVVSWGRETGEKIGEALYTYLNGPNPSSPPTPEKVFSTRVGSTSRTTLVIHDIPTNTILTQFQVPIKAGFISISKSGTMLFCSSPKGDEFFVYSLSHVPTAVHLVATFSRGYTYSRVVDVIWRGDNGCMGVISAHGTGHVFSLKRRGKETARAVGKVKIEGGGVKAMMFVRRGASQVRRRSSTTKDEVVDVLTVATTHERVTSWKLSPAQRSTIGLLTSYFNPPTTEEPQSIPVATAIADYTLPSEHRDIPFSSLISSPVLKAAFTNQRDSGIDCTAKAEVECSLSTRGVTGIRGIRLFEYTFTTSIPDTDFGGPLPWTQKEIDLGMPRGEVRYFGTAGVDGGSSSSPRSLETPPSSEQESPDLQPETGSKKKRRSRAAATVASATKDTGIERAISASLGTELDKTRMTTVPPTPPGSFSTPKVQPSEWMGDILDRGKTIVRNVRRRSSTVRGGAVVHGDEDVCFEDGVEVLSLEDAPTIALDENDSADSDGSSHQGKVRGETSVVGGEMMGQWDM